MQHVHRDFRARHHQQNTVVIADTIESLSIDVAVHPIVPLQCSQCQGAGYLRANVPFGHPQFGKPLPCTCKEEERKHTRRLQLRALSNLDAFCDQTFKTFHPRIPGVQEASTISQHYAQQPTGWLLFVGPNGCGKTHLAAAIANHCLENGATVLFQVVPDLLDHLRAASRSNAPEAFNSLFSRIREAEILILDDLGSQQCSPWANEKLFQLLNDRYNRRIPTVITANPQGLLGVDECIRSRLMDVSLVAQVTFDHARDYRPYHLRRSLYLKARQQTPVGSQEQTSGI